MEGCRLHKQKVMLTGGYMIFILVTSIIPMDRDIEGLRFVIYLKPVVQNLLHIPMFAILAILWLQLFKTYQMEGRKRIIFVLLSSTLFGILSEIIQIFIPGRYLCILDIGSNIIGAVGGVLLYVLVDRCKPSFIKRIICT